MTIHDGYFAVYITCHKSSIPVNTHAHTRTQSVQINIKNLDVKTIPYNPQNVYRACRTGGGFTER